MGPVFEISKKMKISALLCTVYSSVDAQRSEHSRPDEKALGDIKRYNDMHDIAVHIFNGAGKTFDERQYWTYGCHCFFLGDRPLSEMGMGNQLTPSTNLAKNTN